jgi:Fe-S-cluster containining protein
MTPEEQKLLAQKAGKKLRAFQTFFRSFRKKPGREVDEIFHRTHDAVFEKTDCTTCANCCLLGTPIFSRKDIEKLSHYLRLTPGVFQQKYLKQDKEGDLVLQATPCPFLGRDLKCTVYEARPDDCRNFPHTRRKPMGPFINAVLVNTAVCPAAMEIVERISGDIVD